MSSQSLDICSLSGNPDLYGIGVRVGLYLQWITTLLTTLLDPGEEELLRIINLLIQSSIFIGLAFLTSRHEIEAIDPVICVWLLFGALSSLSGSGMNPLGHYSGLFRILLYTALTGYALWFWFLGLDALLQRAWDENGQFCTVIAFFSQTDISGQFRNYNKAASIVAIFICLYFIKKWFSVFAHGPASSTVAGRSKRPEVEIGYLLLSTGIIVLSIVAIEYLLVQNQLSGISSPSSVGQLIPLLVGAFGFADLVFGIVRNRSWRKGRCWLLFRQHLS